MFVCMPIYFHNIGCIHQEIIAGLVIVLGVEVFHNFTDVAKTWMQASTTHSDVFEYAIISSILSLIRCTGRLVNHLTGHLVLSSLFSLPLLIICRAWAFIRDYLELMDSRNPCEILKNHWQVSIKPFLLWNC